MPTPPGVILRAEAQEAAVEAAGVAEGSQAAHDSLAEQMEAWANEHKAARQAAIEESTKRLVAEGKVVQSASSW